MKIVDNSKKYGLPPRYALYNAASDTLTFYASYRGYHLGRLSAIRHYVLEAVAGFFLSFVDDCWKPFTSFALSYEGRVSLHELLSFVVSYTTQADDTQADDTQADDAQADDTQADDAQADDTQADDAQADDTQADDAQAGAVVRSYRRKVSCAGSPDTARYAVVFILGGRLYVRAYQHLTRARAAYIHYLSYQGAGVALLRRGVTRWGFHDSAVNSLSSAFCAHVRDLLADAPQVCKSHFGGGWSCVKL